MKRFKRILRRIVLICLLVLAVSGVGIVGGIPIPKSNTRKDQVEFNVELEDAKEAEEKTSKHQE